MSPSIQSDAAVSQFVLTWSQTVRVKSLYWRRTYTYLQVQIAIYNGVSITGHCSAEFDHEQFADHNDRIILKPKRQKLFSHSQAHNKPATGAQTAIDWIDRRKEDKHTSWIWWSASDHDNQWLCVSFHSLTSLAQLSGMITITFLLMYTLQQTIQFSHQCHCHCV